MTNTRQSMSDLWVPERRKAVLAGMVGHVLEWYDFAVYAYVAAYIGANFFPSQDPTLSLLTSLATFGVGFVARPVGSIVFGRLSDVRGRKWALSASYILMAVATVIIGLLPNFSSIGILAPVLLVAARLVQGLAAGGEVSGAIVFMIEWAPSNRRGLVGSLHQVGSGLGFLLGSFTTAALSSLLTAEQMGSWGWRIPFLIGAIVGPFGYYLRSKVGESPLYERKAEKPSGSGDLGRVARLAVRAFFFSGFWSIAFYLILTYMPTFAQRNLGIAGPAAFWVNTFTLLIYVCAVPIAGALSDRFGRKPMLLLSCLGFAALCYPVFNSLVSTPSISSYFWVVVLFVVLLAFYTGPAPATIAEVFPTKDRGTGIALGYTLSATLFGGFTPLIALWLTERFQSALAPIIYVSIAAALTLIFILTVPETAKRSLD